MRIACAQLNFTVGDLEGNSNRILAAIEKAKAQRCDLILFSELAICGYPPEDLLLISGFVEAVHAQLQRIIQASTDICTVVGTVEAKVEDGKRRLFNSAAIIQNGKLLGFHYKNLLPTYDVFDEHRYFTPGKDCRVWEICGKRVGVTICEDIWQHGRLLREAHYLHDPVQTLVSHTPELVLNLSASPYSFKKADSRIQTVQRTALSLQAPVILCNQVGANDSLLFDGHSCIVNDKGELCHLSKGFEEAFSVLDLNALPPPEPLDQDPIENLYQALAMGIRDYVHKTGGRSVCLGLSGGIDSAVVACLAVEALGKQNVLGVAMPSRFSAKSSVEDAQKLAEALGISFKTVSIEPVFHAFLPVIESPKEEAHFNVVEENLQARIRGTILMSTANREDSLVLNTGNKSELSMGYCTLYGDMCGAISVIGDVTKTMVYALAQFINRNGEVIPSSTLQKAPSAELRPNQLDSDTLPEYGLLDTILLEFIEENHSPETISAKHGYPITLVKEIANKLLKNEYKRRQAPTILRISEKSLTPSAGRRVPIVQRWAYQVKNKGGNELPPL